MSETDDVTDPTDALLTRISDETDTPQGQLVDLVRGVVQIDLKELDDTDAQAALKAWDARDAESFADVAVEYGAPRDDVVGFLNQLFDQLGTQADESGKSEGEKPEPESSPGSPSPNGQSSPQSPGSGGATSSGLSPKEREEVAQIVSEEVDESRIAQQVVSQLQQKGGGQQQATAQQPQGGMNPVVAQALESLVSSEFGGGGGDQLGSEIQKQATQRFVAKAFTPDPGEIMGRMMVMQHYKDMAEDWGMDVDEGRMAEMVEGMFESPYASAPKDDDDE